MTILVNMWHGPKLLVLLSFVTQVHGETQSLREEKVDKLLDKIGESIAQEAAGLTEELAREVKREKVEGTHDVTSRHHHRDANGLKDDEPPDQGDVGKSELNTRLGLQEGIADDLGTKSQAEDDLSKIRFQVGDGKDDRDADKSDGDKGGDGGDEGGETEIQLKIKHINKGAQTSPRKTAGKKKHHLSIPEDVTDRLRGGTSRKKTRRKNRHKTRKFIKSSSDDEDTGDDDTVGDEETRRTIEDGLMTSVASKTRHPKKPKLTVSSLTFRNVEPSNLKTALSAHKRNQGREEGTDEDEDYEDDEIGDLRLKPPIEGQVEEPIDEKFSLIIPNDNASEPIVDTEESAPQVQNSSRRVTSAVVLEAIPPKPVPTGVANASSAPYVFTLPSKDDTSLDFKRRKHGRTRYGKNGDDLSQALEKVGGGRGGKHRKGHTVEKLRTALRNADKPGHPKAEKSVRKELSHELSRDSFPKPGRYAMLNVEGGADKDEDYTRPRTKDVFSKVEVGLAGKIHGETLDDLDVREDVPALEQPEDNSPINTKGKHGSGLDEGKGSLDEKLEREKKRLQEEESRLVNKLSSLERKKEKLEHKKRWRRFSNDTNVKLRKLHHETRSRSLSNRWQVKGRQQRRSVSSIHTLDHVGNNSAGLRKITKNDKLGHLKNELLRLQRERRALLQYLHFRRFPQMPKHANTVSSKSL